jgi:arylsulfatase A-like enzyme
VRARFIGLLVVALGCAPAKTDRALPDVVIVTIDTLRADHLGAYGHEAANTPVIDRLARDGAVFLNAITPLPRTTPALGSLFTGLRPENHGSVGVGQPIESGRMLAERLSEAGWTSLGVSRSRVASERQNLHRGFDRFIAGKAASPITRTALAWIADVDPARPLFLWVHYLDPHFPYRPPDELAPESGAACAALVDDVRARRIRHRAVTRDHGGRASAVRDSCAVLYDAEIAHVDSEVGKLLDGLREAGRLENAFVVLTSDHGENLGERGLYYIHGPSVHDASLRIPLIVVGPGVRPGVHEGIVGLEDMVPTLLGLTQLPASADLNGRDLGGVLRAGEADDRERIAISESASAVWVRHRGPDTEHCWPDGRFGLCAMGDTPGRLYDTVADPDLDRDISAEHPGVAARLEASRARWNRDDFRERTARDLHFKLVRRPRLDGGWDEALYDLNSAAGEDADVSDLYPAEATRLGQALDAWIQRRRAASAAPPEELDPETRDALRALGYAE